MTNTNAASGFLRSRAFRDLVVVALTALTVYSLGVLYQSVSTSTPPSAPQFSREAHIVPACAMCGDDTASDPGTHVLVTLPADGSIPPVVPCLVDMGYVAAPVPSQPGVVGLDVLHGDVELCTEEMAAGELGAGELAV